MENRNSFTEGKIVLPLLRFALPVLGALFLQAMYGAVDLLAAVFSSDAAVTAAAFGVRVPLSFILSRIRPASLFLIGLATPASSAVQIILCLLYFFWFKKKTRTQLP